MIRNILRLMSRIVAFPFIVALAIYQRTLSPDHGLMRHAFPYGVCRHSPTCSAYAMEELRSNVLPVALINIAKRILTCHPWTPLSDERLKEMIDHR
jgi:putative component of membrane protein insertase Oxa1/YidC/SpoIIIJ protein YidD